MREKMGREKCVDQLRSGYCFDAFSLCRDYWNFEHLRSDFEKKTKRPKSVHSNGKEQENAISKLLSSAGLRTAISKMKG
jgi:hypothetical protein